MLWMDSLIDRPETILLVAMMLFLAMALIIGLTFALDPAEPRGIRTIGWLIIGCSMVALGCSSVTLVG